MNEVFTNALLIKLTVDDNGLLFQSGDNITEFPYGSIQGKLKVGLLSNVTVVGHGISKVFVALKQDKERFKRAIEYADAMNKKADPCIPKEYSTYVKSENSIDEFIGLGTKIIFTKDDIQRTKPDGSKDFIKYCDVLTIKCTALGLEVAGANGVKIFHALATKEEKKRAQEMVNFVNLQKTLTPSSNEHRIKCNVCGHIYCYTDSDVSINEQNKKMSNMHTFASTVSAFTVTAYNMYEQQKQADTYDKKLVDFSKCPKCNSTDITPISAEDMQNANITTNATEVSAISSADEIKKYKELLDEGIITQEEFDAKKKQLLGL